MSQYWREHRELGTKSSIRPNGEAQKECWEAEDEAIAPAGGMHVLHHIKRMGEQTTSHQVQTAA